jgi:hypothetical protein
MTTEPTTTDSTGGAIPPARACPNCGAQVLGPYCHACGQEQHVAHSAFAILGKTVVDFVQLDHVLARTLLDLLRRPGGLIADVLRGKTKPYAKPLATLVLVASVYFVLLRWSGLAAAVAGFRQDTADPLIVELASRVRALTMQVGQYLNLAAVPVAAALTWLLDGPQRRPFGQWVVFQGYVYSGTSLIAVLLMLPCIGHPDWYTPVSLCQMLIMWFYAALAAHEAFGLGWLRSLFRVGLATLVASAVVGAAFGVVAGIVLLVQSMSNA